MAKLKLLVTTADFSRFLARDFHYLIEELKGITELRVWHQPGHIHDVLNQIDFVPDFILINEYGETLSPQFTGLDSLNIPFGALIMDLHFNHEQRQADFEKDNVRHIFTYYRDKFYEFYPKLTDRVIWLPTHANTAIFKDYRFEKTIDMLMMGSTHERLYPLRNKIYNTLKDFDNFVYHEHPGWRNFENDAEVFVGQNYAKEINRAKIFFTCDSIYKYSLSKYPQVLACNTLLLASESDELRELGYIPDKHFVAIDENNFVEKAEYYLPNESERLRIAQAGHDMVYQKHTTAVRARELVAHIKRILNLPSEN